MRFLGQDPAGLAEDRMNPYRYALNSPFDVTDPTGALAIVEEAEVDRPEGACRFTAIRPGIPPNLFQTMQVFEIFMFQGKKYQCFAAAYLVFGTYHGFLQVMWPWVRRAIFVASRFGVKPTVTWINYNPYAFVPIPDPFGDP